MSKVKVKSLTFDNLLVTANKPQSKIIIDGSKKNEEYYDVQTVVKAGPYASVDGVQIAEGDKVVLTNTKGIRVAFDKKTGDYCMYDPTKSAPKEEDVDFYFLLTNRSVAMILE